MAHIASSSIITRPEDRKVLVGRRSLTKKFGPGEWETIGGSIEPGETPEECIRREISEELNTTVENCSFFRDYQNKKGDIAVFVITLASEPSFSPDDFEELSWISEDEAKGLEFVLDCKQRLVDYFSV